MKPAIVSICVLLAGCYHATPARPERTELSPDARALLAAAFDAGPTTDDRAERFARHYDAAVRHYDRSAFPEAIAEFEIAYEIEPRPVVLFNVGQAYRKAGRYEAARAKYRQYLAADPGADRSRVEQLIREVEAGLAAAP